MMQTVSPRPLSALFVLATIAAAAPAQRLDWFGAPVLLESLPGELRFVHDLNGDGKVDCLAALGPNLPTGFVPMFNDGFGRFTPGTVLSLPADVGTHVRHADVDGDGHRDLLVATLQGSPMGPGLLVYPGLGRGTFGPPVHIPTAGNIGRLDGGHVDGDGIEDICLMHFDPQVNMHVRWIRGSAARAFTLGPPLTFPFPTPVGSLAVVDVDGDGVDDVALVADNNTGPDGVYLFRTTPTGWAAAGNLPLPAGAASELVVADLDGDGDLDLVAQTSNGTALTLTRLQNGGNGWSVLGSQTWSATGAGRLFVADWDGDGRDDLLLRSNALFQFRNAGGVGFERMPPITIPLVGPSPNGMGAGICDLDGDGDLDFVDSRALLFGDGTYTNPLGGPVATVVGDWDRDGDLDVWHNGIRINDGRGVFPTLVNPPLPTPPAGFQYQPTTLLQDLDGDGLHEMLARYVQQQFLSVLFIEMRWLRESPAGQLVDAGPAAAPGVDVGAGWFDDLDGDGDQDLVNAEGVWLTDSAGFLTVPTAGFGGYQPIAAGDVDGDGDRDLLASKINGGASLALLRRTGPATFAVEVLYPPASAIITKAAGLLADLDDDGDLDVAGYEELGTSQRRVVLFANQGGVFTRVLELPEFTVIGAGDVDGDGRTDLVCGIADRVWVRFRQGSGFAYSAPLAFAVPYATGLADLDQDGDPDLLGQNLLLNRRWQMPAAGQRRQYGAASAGTGLRRPILSFTGPIRTGDVPEIRLRNAVGGGFALLILGGAQASSPVAALPGFTLLASPVLTVLGTGLSGAAGQAGVGGFDVPLPIPPGFGAAQLYFQALVLDPAGVSGACHSNGVEITVGL